MTEIPQFLKRMIVSTINAREIESTRVSRLLHDEVGQVLSAVGLQLDVLKLDFRKDVPEIVERIHEIQKMLDQAVEQVRSLSYDLNPAVVEKAGLHSALDRLVGRYRSVFDGVVRLSFDLSLRPPVPVANALYKLAELALDNAVRHAGAGKIEVSVRMNGRAYMLEVRDNGRGFSPEQAQQSTGLGLLLMEHYAAQVPLRLKVSSEPGKGTVVRCSWQKPSPGDSDSSGETAGELTL